MASTVSESQMRISAGKVDKRQADTEQPILLQNYFEAYKNLNHISNASLTKSHNKHHRN